MTTFQRQQIGNFRADGSVDTSSSPAANNVNLLVNTLLLNYMVLDGKTVSGFGAAFPNHGSGSNPDQWVVFTPWHNKTMD